MDRDVAPENAEIQTNLLDPRKADQAGDLLPVGDEEGDRLVDLAMVIPEVGFAGGDVEARVFLARAIGPHAAPRSPLAKAPGHREAAGPQEGIDVKTGPRRPDHGRHLPLPA